MTVFKLFHKNYIFTMIAIVLCVTIIPATAMVSTDSYSQFESPTSITKRALGKEVRIADAAQITSSFEARTEWSTLRFNNTGAISRTFGSPLPFARNIHDKSGIENSAKKFAKSWAKEFHFGDCDFKIESIRKVLDLTIVIIQPEIDGIQVYDAFLTLCVNKFGEIATIKAQGFGSDISGSFKIGQDAALFIAEKQSGEKTLESDISKIYMPVSTQNGIIALRCAWSVELSTAKPPVQPTFILDAETGEVIASENRISFDVMNGTTKGLYLPLFGPDEPELDVFAFQWLDVEGGETAFTDVDGEFEMEVDIDHAPFGIESKLRGRWVETIRFPNENSAVQNFDIDEIEDVEIVWDDDNSFPDERNLYWHVNFIHNYWVNLENEFDGLDYPLIAGSNLGGEGLEVYEDNAFSSPDGIFFGRGNMYDNFALYADIIYHEYTHSVTREINSRLPGGGEGGAMNEAWSDYFAGSITDDNLMGNGGLMGENYIRNLDNELVYPDDINDEVHDDGRIIGAAMWHTREVLGSSYCDSLFHFAKYLNGRNFNEYFQDVLLTDDEDGNLTNGSPNYAVLYEQFLRHGITLGDFPHFNINQIELFDDGERGANGNGNGVFEPGETIRVEIELFRSGANQMPDNGDVVVMVDSDSDAMEITQNERNIGPIEVGEIVTLAEPLLITLNDQFEAEFVTLNFHIALEEDTIVVDDSLRITIGLPPILIYRDGDDGLDYTHYYRESLDELEMVYSEYNESILEVPLEDQFAMFENLIWFTGNDSIDILDNNERQALENYLDNGGNLIITGQYLYKAVDCDQFFNDYLHVSNTAFLDSPRELMGVEGDPVGNGWWLLLIGESARNQVYPATIEAIEPAEECFIWHREDYQPGAGVRYHNEETGSKSVYLSFGLEAVSGNGPSHSRDEVLQSIIDWFKPVAVREDNSIPLTFSLENPYPNPFNGMIKLPIQSTKQLEVSLKAYDVAGRQIYHDVRNIDVGNSVIELNASTWAAGKYILQVDNGTNSFNRQIVLLK